MSDPNRRRLRELLARPGLIIAPGAYDALSARLIEQAGFEVAYMTGSGAANSLLGQPDLHVLGHADDPLGEDERGTEDDADHNHVARPGVEQLREHCVPRHVHGAEEGERTHDGQPLEQAQAHRTPARGDRLAIRCGMGPLRFH